MSTKKRKLTELFVAACAFVLQLGVANAQDWENWEIEGNTFAGFCTAAADETCIEVSCGTDGFTLALISLGAWSVTKGAKESITIRVDGQSILQMEGVIEEAKGFGPEFYATKGTINTSVVSALSTGSAASFAFDDGYVLDGFGLSGSKAALSAAGC